MGTTRELRHVFSAGGSIKDWCLTPTQSTQGKKYLHDVQLHRYFPLPYWEQEMLLGTKYGFLVPQKKSEGME